jgi:hypothetical protein
MELYESVMSSNAAARCGILLLNTSYNDSVCLLLRCDVEPTAKTLHSARHALHAAALSPHPPAQHPKTKRLRQPLRVTLLPERGTWLSLPPRFAAALLDVGVELPLVVQLAHVDSTTGARWLCVLVCRGSQLLSLLLCCVCIAQWSQS